MEYFHYIYITYACVSFYNNVISYLNNKTLEYNIAHDVLIGDIKLTN